MDHIENDKLCRITAGTPMGNLLRRYWIPADLSSNLDSLGTAPRRIKLLGETFVAFRAPDGSIGFLDDACPHRGAPLSMGRVGEGCITCLYHGWKISAAGEILETPNVQQSEKKTNRKARSFPTCESGGLIWVYLGPDDQMPPEPSYPFTTLDEKHRVSVRTIIPSNWVQSLESSLDPSHLAILHADYSPLDPSQSEYSRELRGGVTVKSNDLAPKIEADVDSYGVKFAALRDLPDGSRSARVSVFVGPFMVFVPPSFAVIYVPVDDVHTAQTVVYYDPQNAVDHEKFRAMSGFFAPGVVVNDHLNASEHNNFLQDRSKMGESWTGIDGLLLEDAAMLAGMRPIVDRSKENLVASDIAIVRTRRWLQAAAKELEQGHKPLQLGAAGSDLEPWDGMLSREEAWQAKVSPRKAMV